MKKYAESIPKPHVDAKVLLKEKISQALERQGQPSYPQSSCKEEPMIEAVKEGIPGTMMTGEEYRRKMMTLTTSSHIPIRKKGNKKDHHSHHHNHHHHHHRHRSKTTTTNKRKNSNSNSNTNSNSNSNSNPNSYVYAYEHRLDGHGNRMNSQSQSQLQSQSQSSLEERHPSLGGGGEEEHALSNALPPSTTPSPKKSNLVLPPISPNELQLWNLEQEHRKAMDKVETIKRELNL
eukprot:jgi/Orpsp1_1/1179599/evm.model.c7180000070022.2